MTESPFWCDQSARLVSFTTLCMTQYKWFNDLIEMLLRALSLNKCLWDVGVVGSFSFERRKQFSFTTVLLYLPLRFAGIFQPMRNKIWTNWNVIKYFTQTYRWECTSGFFVTVVSKGKSSTLYHWVLLRSSYLQCTMIGALVSPCFFLSSLVAVTKPTNKATFGIARSFHDVNFMCEISREEEAFCSVTKAISQLNSQFILEVSTGRGNPKYLVANFSLMSCWLICMIGVLTLCVPCIT